MVDRIDISFRNTQVGHLERTDAGFIFQWTSAYIEIARERRVGLIPRGTTAFNAFPLSTTPVNCAHFSAFDGIPPFLRDSLPDAWGALVMRATFSRLNQAGSDDPLMQLAYVGNRGLGGFVFTPALSNGSSDAEMVAAIDGARLAYLANILSSGIDGSQLDAQTDFPLLSQNAGTAGGAHPKCLVGFEPATERLFWGANSDALHAFRPELVPAILKLDYPVNSIYATHPLYYRNLTRIEAAYNEMAVAAGLNPPRCTLLRSESIGNPRYDLVIPRFDRHAGVRNHQLTFSAIAHLRLADKVAAYGSIPGAFMFSPDKPVGLSEFFRRAIFNFAAHVTDDHVKNHAFTFDGKRWAVSPPYDLVYSPKSSHATTINFCDSPHTLSAAALNALADACGIRGGQGQQRAIVQEVLEAVRGWTVYATRAGMEPAMTAEIDAALSAGCRMIGALV